MKISTSYKNILLIKPGAIGDLLQLTPVIRALAGRFPGAEISVLTGSWATATLFAHHPQVRSVLVFDKRGEHRRFVPFLSLWNNIRSGNYDLVVNFQRSNLKTWVLATAALPCRILVYHKSRSNNVHVVDNYLATLEPLCLSSAARQLDLYVGPQADQQAEKLFRERGWLDRQVIALNPGASHSVNRWSAGRFAELANMITERLHAQVIVIGGPEDRALAAAVAAAARSRPVVLTGTLDLLELGAVLKRCALLVSGDTGPLHLATAVRIPVVGLFGAADPARTGPVGQRCRVVQARDVGCVPCRSRTCTNAEHLACMEHIGADDVFEAVRALLLMPA